MEIICFFAGILFTYTQSLYLPSFVFLVLAFKFSRSIPFWFIIGVIFALFHEFSIQDKNMPSASTLQKAILTGKIISIPTHNLLKTQFQFQLSYLNKKPVKAIVLLNCYKDCNLFKVNQGWQLQAKLKPPKNLNNPGSFNYINFLNGHHIHWVGDIKQGENRLITSTSSNLLALRERFANTVNQTKIENQSLGIIQALTLGITTNIQPDLWRLFRRTGTTHLMVISGAHIGLVASLTYGLIKWFWGSSSQLCLYYPALQIASIGATLTAFAYTLLAGFGVPAQRALVACFFLLLRFFLSCRFTAWQAWRYGLAAVLTYEPHSVLLPGFYLSFLAVAILIAANQRLSSYRGFKKTFLLQIACLIGLMPFTLYWFSYGALNGLVANLLAIPLVGYVIVPLSLISVVLLQIFPYAWLLLPANVTIKFLLFYLNWVDHLSIINLHFTLIHILSLLALMISGMIFFFLPLRPLIFAAILLSVSTLFPSYSRLKEGEAQIDVMDVGQGLAVIIHTQKHLLIYDTGMKFYQGNDMAQLAIIPYLNRLGIKKIDKIIISHPDLDHRGGLVSLETNYSIDELIVDNPAFYQHGKNCHQYPSWQWDGVVFRFFPIKRWFRDKNNSSCVLQIAASGGSILLPGDIEKVAENYLVSTYQKQLTSDVLVLAHHGSKTSSTKEFINQINPRFAIISAGIDNRYHFPHAQTIATLVSRHINLLNTMTCGMVTIKLSSHLPVTKPTCYA